MKLKRVLGWSAALCLSALAARAQETNGTENVQNQIKQLQENFERQQRELRENFERMIREQQAQIEALKKQIGETSKPPVAGTDQKKPEQELASTVSSNQAPADVMAPVSTPPASTGWSPAAPITVARAGSSYMNISFDAMMDVGSSTASDPSQYLQLGDHDPQNRGFSMRNAEIAVDGAVDPYFKGFGNIVLKLDQNNETSIELEEAYGLTTSLPEDLQLKAGQFFAAFGRQNAQHPHQWAFVDEPIILSRAFGPDGLRNVGAQLSWLAPTAFYTEATLGILNGQGGTAFSFRNPGELVGGVNRFHGRTTLDRNLSGAEDLVYVPRLASSFDLTDNQTLVAGVSGAFGPNNTDTDARTEIAGADVYWKWKPANSHSGFPFVSWQTEALYQWFDAGADPTAPTGPLPAETLRDWGFYSQVLWGFRERWVAGLRGEYADGNHGAYDPYDVFRGQRTRVSPDLTFFPSEFSKVRLQYNYDQGQYFGTEHSIWLQFEFLLGAHGAHKF
jgi:uncharacterized membrane-anchored protein YhcB (DUF1043 family)